MKKLLFLFFLISILGFSQTGDKTISNVEVRGSWYYIYDEKGKKMGSFSASLGKLEGFGNDFIVLGKGSWYYLYDEKGKKYGSVSKSVGKIVSVSGNTFTVNKGSWNYIYSKTGKKIGSRAAK